MLFANPIAGRGRGERLARRLAGALTRRGWQCEVVFDHAAGVDDRRLAGVEDCRAIITVGGDGTLRTVVGRLLARLSPARVPPLCVVPLGTANLMALHLKLGWTEEIESEVVAALAAGRTQAVDIARANGDVCLLVAGVGIDGQVVHSLDALRTGPITKLSYVRPILESIGWYAFPPVTVIADGRELCRETPALVFVGNVAEYGTGFPILRHAVSDDGLLDVCVLPCRKKVDLLRWAVGTTLGRHTRSSAALYTTAKHVRIEAEAPVPAQIDGEAAGFTPLDLCVLDERLAFIVKTI